MEEAYRCQFKAVSFLLQFPDTDLLLALPALEVFLMGRRTTKGGAFVPFIAYLKDTALIRLQEAFTSTFYLNPATCLNLTYHVLGDLEHRGRALEQILQVYHQAGYEPVGGDLPDYLPLVLEFLSVAPDTGKTALLWHYLAAVEPLADRLRRVSSPYAPLLFLVEDLRCTCGQGALPSMPFTDAGRGPDMRPLPQAERR